ncbi:hypothetical protein S83_016233, partial [Arachis hypogaea]
MSQTSFDLVTLPIQTTCCHWSEVVCNNVRFRVVKLHLSSSSPSISNIGGEGCSLLSPFSDKVQALCCSAVKPFSSSNANSSLCQLLGAGIRVQVNGSTVPPKIFNSGGRFYPYFK